MSSQQMPGTLRLLRLSVLLPIASILVLGLTAPWEALGLPDLPVAVLVILALLPALFTWLPHLQALFGERHLPVTLSVYLLSQTFLTSLLHNLGLVRFDMVQIGPLSFIEPGVLLMLPALLMAWQYGWRGALLASAATGLLHLLTGLTLHAFSSDLGYLATVTPLLRPDLLFFLPLFIAYLTELLHRQQTQQRQVQAQLREYAATAGMLAVGRERSRLANRLQDTLNRTMNALREQLENIGSAPDAVSETLAAVQRQVDSGFEEAQQVIADLQAPRLADLGLTGALQARAESLAQRSHIQVDFSAQGDLAGLTEEQELVLYHVADEALSSAESHADVQRVALNLVCFEQTVALTIHDDGLTRQCEANDDDGCDDMESSLACAQLIGGQLCMDSQAGQGNTVAFWIPCGRPDEHRLPG